MGIVIRQSIKSVVVTVGGVLLGALITILSTRYFPKTEFGFREILIKVALQVSYIGLFGFSLTTVIYGQRYPPGHKARGTFLTLMLIFPLITTCIVCAGYFLFADYIGYIYQNGSDARMIREYLVLFPLLTFLSTAMSWMEGYLLALNKTALQNFAREILARIIYITLIILYACNIIGFSTFIWLYVVLYLVPFIFLVWVAMRSPGFRFEYHKGMFSRAEVKDIFRFSGYHMLSIISSVLLLQLDAILLAPIRSFKVVAVYSVATLAISMLRNPTRVMATAAIPSFTHHYNENNMKLLSSMFSRSVVNMQIIGIGMFIIMYLNINNIVSVMAMVQEGYEEIGLLIMILMIGQVVDMASGFNSELLSVTKYYRINFWISVLLLVIVFLLNYFLIRRIGIYGAAWATTIGLVVFNLLKAFFLRVKLGMHTYKAGGLRILLIGIIAGGAAWLIPNGLPVFADIFVRSALFCGLYWFLVYKARISDELNTLTHNIITKRKLY